ncbi:MAG: hypothetical protein Tsb0021_11440 [Chlamydiales bacterium]
MMINKTVKLFVGTVLGILFLYLALRGISFQEFKDTIGAAKWGYFFPLIGLSVLFFFIKAIRWKWLLHPTEKVETKKLFPSMVVGIAFNYILFAYVGEFVRTYLLSRETRMRKASILGSIFLERTFDLMMILLLTFVALFFSAVSLPHWEEMKVGFIFTIVTLIFFIAALFVWEDRALKIFAGMLHWLSQDKKNALIQQIQLAIKGFHSLGHFDLFLGIVLSSLFMWLAMAGCNYMAMLSVNIQVPFYATFFTMALLVLGILLPNTPGHIGVVELCFVITLQPFGVPKAEAFAAGLVFHFFQYSLYIGWAIYYLHVKGLRFRDVQSEAEQLQASESRHES